MMTTANNTAGVALRRNNDAANVARRSLLKVLSALKKPSLREAGVVLFDQGFRSATTFLTGVFVARYCSIAEHGRFVVAFTMILLVSNLQETLIGTPLYVLFPARRGRFAEEYQRCTTIWQGILAGAAAVILSGVGYLTYLAGSGFGLLLLCVGPVAGATMIRDYARQRCFARMLPGLALWVDVPTAILQLGVIAVLSRYGVLTGPLALAAMGLAAFLVCLVPFVSALGLRRRIEVRYLWEIAKSHVVFGRWLILSRAIYWLVIGCYPFIVATVCGPEAAGVFGACHRIPLLFAPVMAGMINFLLPYLSHRLSNHSERAARRMVTWANGVILAGMGTLTVFIFLFGRVLLHWLYQEKYLGNLNTLYLLVLAVFAQDASYCVSIAFVATKRPWLDALVYGLAGVISLPLGVWGCMRCGVNGAVGGYLLCVLIVGVLRWTIFLKAGPVSPCRSSLTAG